MRKDSSPWVWMFLPSLMLKIVVLSTCGSLIPMRSSLNSAWSVVSSLLSLSQFWLSQLPSFSQVHSSVLLPWFHSWAFPHKEYLTFPLPFYWLRFSISFIRHRSKRIPKCPHQNAWNDPENRNKTAVYR